MARTKRKSRTRRAATRAKVEAVAFRERETLREAVGELQLSAREIHQTFEFANDKPDVAFLCEVAAELLNGVVEGLGPRAIRLHRTPLSVASHVETQSRTLLRTEAVLIAMIYFLQTESKAPDLVIAFTNLAQTCATVHERLDHVPLGLPIPYA